MKHCLYIQISLNSLKGKTTYTPSVPGDISTPRKKKFLGVSRKIKLSIKEENQNDVSFPVSNIENISDSQERSSNF